MGEDDTDRTYYVISDLHIGGDEQLDEVEFLDELLDFLGQLERTDENTELVINGDAFGLWEITTVEGKEKFDILVENHPELFDQLEAEIEADFSSWFDGDRKVVGVVCRVGFPDDGGPDGEVQGLGR
jgi:UDP-2,3-diacylglucosamine pyrophosphatase LpxH